MGGMTMEEAQSKLSSMEDGLRDTYFITLKYKVRNGSSRKITWILPSIHRMY